MNEVTQGDICIPLDKRLEALPEGATRVPDDPARGVVLAYGEATGAAHVMTPGKVAQWDVAGQRYIALREPATIVHDSPGSGHGESTLIPPGVYPVVRPVEYDYSADVMRPVVD